MTQFTPPVKFCSSKKDEWFDMFSPRDAKFARDAAGVHFYYENGKWEVMTELEKLKFIGNQQKHNEQEAKKEATSS